METKSIDIYVNAFEHWSELANISEWQTWSESVLARPKGYFYPSLLADLYELHGWMIGMEYRLPNLMHEFQATFENFRLKLEELLYVFTNKFERSEADGFYWVEKSSAFGSFSAATIDYHHANRSMGLSDLLIERAMFQLTCAANHLIERSIADFGDGIKGFRLKTKIKYLGGPYGPAREFCPEFSDKEKISVYDRWISEDRLNTILADPGKYIGSDFLPLFHRTVFDL